MKLKLKLVRNGETIFEIPLSPTDWSRPKLNNELEAFKADFQRFSKIFTALSNETRLMMMKRLMEEEDRTIHFADFMRDLQLNPKIVWENSRKLREGGLLEKIGRGRYRCSEFGVTSFMMMSLALRRQVS
jgi:DNA-binding transcriptional ArsR family regulator